MAGWQKSHRRYWWDYRNGSVIALMLSETDYMFSIFDFQNNDDKKIADVMHENLVKVAFFMPT